MISIFFKLLCFINIIFSFNLLLYITPPSILNQFNLKNLKNDYYHNYPKYHTSELTYNFLKIIKN